MMEDGRLSLSGEFLLWFGGLAQELAANFLPAPEYLTTGILALKQVSLERLDRLWIFLYREETSYDTGEKDDLNRHPKPRSHRDIRGDLPSMRFAGQSKALCVSV